MTDLTLLAQSGPIWPNMLVPLLVLVPLIGGIVLTVTPKAEVHRTALINSTFTFFVSLVVLLLFDFDSSAALQMVSRMPWVSSFGLSFGFGLDAISLWLVLLTTFLMPLVVLGSKTAVTKRTTEFYVWLLLLEAAMIGVFVATDLIFFYICFEFTLIPLYFLIGIFGSTQRLKAARVFFLYTFTGSMLTFAGLLYVAWFNARITGEWSFSIATLTIAAGQMSLGQQCWVFAAMLAGFAVKVPLFPVHTWLPLAHTEAPTAGSVILAGVLLKLGTYAMLRFVLPMTPEAVIRFAPLIGVLAVIGILYTAAICWVQKDIKKLIAYSSVSHLGFCVLGMFALNAEGMSGSVMYMVNHGLSTGALFLCVGMIYERYHTREMRAYGGLARVMPVWSFFMVFFCLASVGLPGLNGFVGEFLSLIGTFKAAEVLGPSYAIAAGFGMILAAIYILYMVGRVVFGPVNLPAHEGHDDHAPAGAGAHGQSDHARAADLNRREIFILLPIAVACLWLGLYPRPMLRSIDDPLTRIREPALQVLADAQPDDSQTPLAAGTPVQSSFNLDRAANTKPEQAR